MWYYLFLVIDTSITDLLMEDINLDQSDIECVSENEEEEIPFPTMPLPRTYHIPGTLFLHDWSDDTDEDPDYDPGLIYKSTDDDESTDDEQMPSTSAKVRVCESIDIRPKWNFASICFTSVHITHFS